MIANLKSAAAAMVMVVVMMAMLVSLSESKCEFEAIFNFGDSNSDTGGFWAAFPAQGPPNGMTYFKKPSGRASDGRLIIDFLGISFHSFYHLQFTSLPKCFPHIFFAFCSLCFL